MIAQMLREGKGSLDCGHHWVAAGGENDRAIVDCNGVGEMSRVGRRDEGASCAGVEDGVIVRCRDYNRFAD